MRRLILFLSVALLAAACAEETLTPLTTTTAAVEEPSSTTTTTVVEATTTTVVGGPIDICRKGTMWNEPGAVYVADCFIVSVFFQPQDEGWRSARANEEVVFGTWVEPGRSSPTAHYVVLAYEPSEEPDAVVDSITSIGGVNPISDPVVVEVGDVSGVVVDLETDPIEGFVDSGGDVRECSPSESPLTSLDYASYPLLYPKDFPGPGVYVLAACRPFRMWVLDAGDVAVTVVWTPDDPDRFDELVPVAERMVESITFEAP